MSEYRLKDVVRTNRLREAYGDEIVLTEDGREESVPHSIVLEFDVAGHSYAVLQSQDLTSNEAGEISIFRIRIIGEGEYEIETIEDDDEWEEVSELVDEMTTRFTDDI
jgi:uncharacterized protein YrzB (UPF0473 family)